MSRVARALRAVDARVLGERCPTCGERSKFMVAHAFIDHGDERPW